MAVGYVDNTATATGTDPMGNPVTDISDAGDDAVETPDGAGNTDGNPTNDPTTYLLPCSIGNIIWTVACNNNGTQNDPSDDLFTVNITVLQGLNNGPIYSISGGITGVNLNYNQNYTFGPFLISNGNLNIVISDSANPSCTKAAIIEAPLPCSSCSPNLPGLPIKAIKQ
jgi:hypothetical protein